MCRTGGRRCKNPKKIAERNERRREAYQTKLAEQSIQRQAQVASVVVPPSELNSKHVFINVLPSKYDSTKVKPVRMVTDISWSKPLGGLWLSTPEGNVSGWDSLLGNTSSDVSARDPELMTRFEFKNDAKVLRIDSLEDYRALLDVYGYRPKLDPEAVASMVAIDKKWERRSVDSNYTADGGSKRVLDFKKMSKDFDAMFLTWKGLGQCGKGDYRDTRNTFADDSSLNQWDIESVFVMNPDALQANATEWRKPEVEEQDDYYNPWDDYTGE